MDIRIVDKTRATDTFQKLPRGSRILLNGILKHCINRRLWASQKTMSEWSQDFGGLSVPAIKRHLPILKEVGFLVEIPTPANTTNGYNIILFPSGDNNKPPQANCDPPVDQNKLEYPTVDPTRNPTCILEKIQTDSDPVDTVITNPDNLNITNTDPLEPLILPDLVQNKYIPPVPVNENYVYYDTVDKSIQSISQDQVKPKIEFVKDKFVTLSSEEFLPFENIEPEIDIFAISKEKYRQELIARRKELGIIEELQE